MNRTVLTTLGVFLQSFLLWWVSESAAVPLIAVGLVTLQRLFRLRWPRKPRASWLWASAFMLVALAVFLLSTRGDDGEFALATLRLPIAHCLLLAQVLVLLHQSPSDSTPGWFPGVALATCFLAFHQTVAPQQQALFLLLAIACVLCFGSLYQTTTRLNHAIDSQPVSPRRVSLIAVLVSSALGAYAVAGAWEIAVANVQAALPMWAARAGHSVRTSRGYVRTGVLGSITLEKQNDPMHVALRVYATKTPGYLRGRVFET